MHALSTYVLKQSRKLHSVDSAYSKFNTLSYYATVIELLPLWDELQLRKIWVYGPMKQV